MTKAQVSGSLLLRTHSVTAYATTALVRLILRRATQYIVTTCVCEKRPGNCFLPPWPVPVASVHVGVGREPSRKPAHAAEQLSARCASTAQAEGVASSLRLEPLGWISDASCSSSTRLVISAARLADVANQNAAMVGPGELSSSSKGHLRQAHRHVPKDDLVAIRTIGAEVCDSLLVRNSWTSLHVRIPGRQLE